MYKRMAEICIVWCVK